MIDDKFIQEGGVSTLERSRCLREMSELDHPSLIQIHQEGQKTVFFTSGFAKICLRKINQKCHSQNMTTEKLVVFSLQFFLYYNRQRILLTTANSLQQQPKQHHHTKQLKQNNNNKRTTYLIIQFGLVGFNVSQQNTRKKMYSTDQNRNNKSQTHYISQKFVACIGQTFIHAWQKLANMDILQFQFIVWLFWLAHQFR